MARRKIVDADNVLAQREKILQQVRADEAGDAGDDPDFGRRCQALSEKFVRRGGHVNAVEASSIPSACNRAPLISRLATGAYHSIERTGAAPPNDFCRGIAPFMW